MATDQNKLKCHFILIVTVIFLLAHTQQSFAIGWKNAQKIETLERKLANLELSIEDRVENLLKEKTQEKIRELSARESLLVEAEQSLLKCKSEMQKKLQKLSGQIESFNELAKENHEWPGTEKLTEDLPDKKIYTITLQAYGSDPSETDENIRSNIEKEQSKGSRFIDLKVGGGYGMGSSSYYQGSVKALVVLIFEKFNVD